MTAGDRASIINRKCPTRLSDQVARDLAFLISEGAFDGTLPSEPVLMAAYEVSRITIQRAKKALIRDGLIITLHGRGTFIAS